MLLVKLNQSQNVSGNQFLSTDALLSPSTWNVVPKPPSLVLEHPVDLQILFFSINADLQGLFISVLLLFWLFAISLPNIIFTHFILLSFALTSILWAVQIYWRRHYQSRRNYLLSWLIGLHLNNWRDLFERFMIFSFLHQCIFTLGFACFLIKG